MLVHRHFASRPERGPRGKTPPPLLSHQDLHELARRVAACHPALFLDFDGTLTPIRPSHEAVRLAGPMQARLRRLGRLCPVAIVSGRDLVDLDQRVDVAGLALAGCHGMEITTRGGQLTVGEAHLPALRLAELELRDLLRFFPGALLERKRLGIAVHLRRALPAHKPAVGRLVDRVAASHPELRRSSGKEVEEIHPNIDWNKGRAVDAIIRMDRLHNHLPVFIGDDLTDEDGFHAVAGSGIGILVGSRPSAAHWAVPHVTSVGVFLSLLANQLEGERNRTGSDA